MASYLLTLLWGCALKLRPVGPAVNNFTGNGEVGLNPRERPGSSNSWLGSPQDPLLFSGLLSMPPLWWAAGTLSSIIGPDHKSLGSVLSAVPRQTTGPGVGQGCSQLIAPAWCLFPPLCALALSVSPGLPLPTVLAALGAGSTLEMSALQRQGSVPTQSSADLSLALRSSVQGDRKEPAGCAIWKITLLCVGGTLQR